MHNHHKGLPCLALFIVAIILGIVSTVLFAVNLTPFIAHVFPLLAANALFVLAVLITLLILKAFWSSSALDTNTNVLRCIGDCITEYAFCVFTSAHATLIASLLIITIALIPAAFASQLCVFIVTTLFWWMSLAFFALISCIIKAVIHHHHHHC